jgi:hypothetical protein
LFSNQEIDAFEATLSVAVVDLEIKNGATAPDMHAENNKKADVEVLIIMEFIRIQKSNTLYAFH